MFVLNLTVTKFGHSIGYKFTLRRIWSSRGIWILTVRDRTLPNGFGLVFIVCFSKDLVIEPFNRASITMTM